MQPMANARNMVNPSSIGALILPTGPPPLLGSEGGGGGACASAAAPVIAKNARIRIVFFISCCFCVDPTPGVASGINNFNYLF